MTPPLKITKLLGILPEPSSLIETPPFIFIKYINLTIKSQANNHYSSQKLHL